MRKNNKILIGLIVTSLLGGLYLSSCATTSSSYQPDGSGGSTSSAQMPAWFTKPYSVVPESLFVAATGEGLSAEEAQYKARVSLLQIFKVDIADETVLQELYQENTVNGVTNWSNTVAMESKISASAAGILSGAEVRENQQIGNRFYSLAVMDKAKTINIYTDIINRLSADINEALNVPKNTFDGYTRHLLAANIAKDIDACVNVLRFVGGSGSVPAGLKSENEYKIEANNIIKTIPVRISVMKTPGNIDPSNRVQAAFAKAIGDIGFQSGGSGSRYALDVNVSIEPVPMANNPNVFSRIVVTANLTDTATRTVLVPFNFDTREGHNSQANADNRVIMAAESRINSEFKPNLEKYISNLSRSK